MNDSQRQTIVLLLNGLPFAAAQPVMEWQPLAITCAPLELGNDVRLWIGAEDVGSPTLQLGDPTWRWTWNPEDRTGTFAVTLTAGATIARWTLTVIPSKLRLEQYEQLLHEVQATALALMLALGGGTLGAERGPYVTPTSLLLTWPQLEQQVAHLLDLAQAIARQPQVTSQHTIMSRPLHELDTLDGAVLADLARQPLDEVGDDALPALQARLRPSGQIHGGLLPYNVRTSATIISHDCLEHRLLRAVVDRLALRVAEIGALMYREQQRRTHSGLPLAQLEAMQRAQQQAARELRRIQALPLLHDLPGATHCDTPTHLMRHDRRYRAVYQLWRSLRELPQLALDSPLFSLPLADLPTLYEQWCLLQTAAYVCQFGTIEHHCLFKVGPRGGLAWSMSLAENCPLLVIQLPDGARATLYYQRRYQPAGGQHGRLVSLDPFLRIPDIAIEIEQLHQAPKSLLLDAKYRVMPNGTLPQNALDTAYTYHGAIGYNGQAATLGAWLLFPGTTPILAGEVGALPMLPGHTDTLASLLQRIMSTYATT